MHKITRKSSLTTLFGVMILCFTTLSSAQTIQGRWEIDKLILDASNQEFYLTPLSDEPTKKYGNRFDLKEDGSFQSRYTAWCGMDCFTSSFGSATFSDARHVQFRIDTIHYERHCDGHFKANKFPIDAGIYCIHKKNDQIRLIKSNGDLEQDELNIRYSDSIDVQIKESAAFNNLVTEIRPDSEIECTPENIASLCMEATGRTDYKLLYWKKSGYRNVMVLIEVDNEWKTICCNETGSIEKRLIYSVSLFDRQILNPTEKLVHEINNLKRFKIEKSQKQEENAQEFVTIYKKKKEIKKVTIERNDRYGKTIVACYYESEQPFYMKITHDFVHLDQKAISCKAFYFITARGVVSKEIEKPDIYGRDIGDSDYYRYLKQLETLIEKE